jgi:hypothetical protein
MEKKTLIIASFIFPERLEWFLNYLESKFNIKKNNVFCYKNIDDESKIILTFKLINNSDRPLNLKDLFPSAIIIHKKGDALYTINALNKMIEEINPESIGNISKESIKINWEEYQNKMILLNGDKLSILNIERVF